MDKLIIKKYLYEFVKFYETDKIFAQHAFTRELSETEIGEYLSLYPESFCKASVAYMLDGKL
jgi:hypothetical protein